MSKATKEKNKMDNQLIFATIVENSLNYKLSQLKKRLEKKDLPSSIEIPDLMLSTLIAEVLTCIQTYSYSKDDMPNLLNEFIDKLRHMFLYGESIANQNTNH